MLTPPPSLVHAPRWACVGLVLLTCSSPCTPLGMCWFGIVDMFRSMHPAGHVLVLFFHNYFLISSRLGEIKMENMRVYCSLLLESKHL